MSSPLQSGLRAAGLTLIELLAALAIGAILMMLAVPVLSRQRAEAAVRAAADRTVAALHLAREQALATGHSQTVCPSADASRCGFGPPGWMLFENLPGGSDSRRETAEPVVQQWRLPQGVLVRGTRGYATYQPGTSAATTLTFDFCYATVPAARRSVIVSQSGRARITRPAAGATPQPCRA
jgi:type IV fimbrial biogenesis protein FimT